MSQRANERQIVAIQAPLTPHLVIAGAGSGKTFVLIERMIHLIKKENIHPNRIWAITFTNKASREMRERIQKRCGFVPKHIATFHASCVKFLKQKINLLGLNCNFNIIDSQDQATLIRRIVKEYNKYEISEKIKVARIRLLIKFFKNNYLKPDTLSFDDFCHVAFDLSTVVSMEEAYRFFLFVYRNYQNYLLTENYLDFDDILNYAFELTAFPEAVEYWANKFDAILIDEFQDTDNLQLSIVTRSIINHQNIFCVGDPDQSIYAWRGADPKIFTKFQELFPNHTLIKLEQNYRSTQRILNVANKLIEHNPNRIPKQLYTVNNDGEKIQMAFFHNSVDEAHWVVQKIQQLKATDPESKLSEITVLYRNNSLSKYIEEALIEADLNYQIVGGIKFYRTEEIRTIIAYLNILLYDDALSLEKVCNIPTRKIGPAALEKINNFARQQRISLFEAFQTAEMINGLSKVAINGCKDFIRTIQKIRQLNQSDFAKLIDDVLKVSGYLDSLDVIVDAKRLENIDTLKNSFADIQKEQPEITLDQLLSEVALNTDLDDYDTNQQEAINLMTIHNSKGLEFKYVFVVKMTEGILPSHKNLDPEKIEEERRIAYVAFTRAKKRLFISGSSSYDYKTKKNLDKSEFLTEIERLSDLEIDVTNHRPIFNKFDIKSSFNKKFNREKHYHENSITYQQGMFVVHENFGIGVIIGMGKMGAISTLKIKFHTKNQTVEIIANNKKLKPLKN